MTGEEFLEVINDIDESFIAEAAPKKQRHQRRIILHWAAVFAVIMALILPAAATEYRHTLFGKWTSEIFTFVPNSEDYTIPADNDSAKVYSNPGLAEFDQALKAAGITANVVPTWIPEGYDYLWTESYVYEDSAALAVIFCKGDQSLSLLVESPTVNGHYEKDEREIVIYKKANVTHYIMHNLDTVGAAWNDGVVECSLVGPITVEEMQKIIDSIYTESE